MPHPVRRRYGADRTHAAGRGAADSYARARTPATGARGGLIIGPTPGQVERRVFGDRSGAGEGVETLLMRALYTIAFQHPESCMYDYPSDWPEPPIWRADLPLIRELLTDEEWTALLRRLVSVSGKLEDFQRVLPWPPGDN